MLQKHGCYVIYVRNYITSSFDDILNFFSSWWALRFGGLLWFGFGQCLYCRSFALTSRTFWLLGRIGLIRSCGSSAIILFGLDRLCWCNERFLDQRIGY